MQLQLKPYQVIFDIWSPIILSVEVFNFNLFFLRDWG